MPSTVLLDACNRRRSPATLSSFHQGRPRTSTTFCIAIGSACLQAAGSGQDCTDSPFVERWDGTSWTWQLLPTAAGATSPELRGLSCASSTACIAVGDVTGSNGTDAMAMLWDGTRWSIHDPPSAASATGTQLNGVSCSSATACTAVGSENDPELGSQTLAEFWDGSTWSIQSTANPAGGDNQDASLSSVSCPTAANCTAVGIWSNATNMLAEAWDGASWTIHSAPNPTSGGLPITSNQVSCTHAAWCAAVGSAQKDTSGGEPADHVFSEVWNGSSWTLDSITDPPGAISSTLTGVSCPTVDCIAVGTFTTSASTSQPLVESRPATGQAPNHGAPRS
jgi:hypothetical protein